MNMKMIIATCLSMSMAVLLVSCAAEKSTTAKHPYPPGHFAQQITRLESANVTNDVNAAMMDSDRKFLVCVGWGGTVPGVPHWNEDLSKKYGTRILDGTGDMILTDEQKEFKATAQAYAEAYNKLLWSKTEGNE
jgi:hypothetical protein